MLISTIGEAVAVAIAEFSSSQMATCDHGIIAKTKRVIMDRDLYLKKLGRKSIWCEEEEGNYKLREVRQDEWENSWRLEKGFQGWREFYDSSSK